MTGNSLSLHEPSLHRIQQKYTSIAQNYYPFPNMICMLLQIANFKIAKDFSRNYLYSFQLTDEIGMSKNKLDLIIQIMLSPWFCRLSIHYPNSTFPQYLANESSKGDNQLTNTPSSIPIQKCEKNDKRS